MTSLNAAGSPKIVFLRDVLDKEFGSGKTKMILPITDPMSCIAPPLGSCATVFFQEPPTAAMKVINKKWVSDVCLLPHDQKWLELPGGDRSSTYAYQEE